MQPASKVYKKFRCVGVVLNHNWYIHWNLTVSSLNHYILKQFDI